MLNCRTVKGEKEGSSKAAEAAKSAPSTNIFRPTNGRGTCHQGPFAIGFKDTSYFMLVASLIHMIPAGQVSLTRTRMRSKTH